ncbi:PucR family transcriptional regulator [Lentzea sp. NPDC051213]|uniref:PucR family transcriptional regulator n=1 Tax=Lentzea sp. NPDC051213 TaxID=3364126 RepID=UPI0037B86EB9
MSTLARVLDELGTTLIDLLAGDPGRADDVGGVVIDDPLDDQVLPGQALVLGIGLREPAEISARLAELGTHDAAALMVRAPLAVTDEIIAAAEHSGVALLGLAPGASWTQLAALLRSLLAEDDVGPGETLGGLPSGDLFALANAVAALIGAPVTIEDRSSRVLAFSGRQEDTDPSRVETILGRQVPRKYSQSLEQRGVFRRLYRSGGPVYIDSMPGDETVLPRMAIAVRAGDEILGSIWAVVREPLPDDRARAFCDAANLVALHLMRQRAGADVERRLRADLVSTAVEGGAGAAEALRRLGLADQAAVVLALALEDSHGDDPARHAEHLAQRQQIADALAMHLSAVHPRAAAALVGDVAYAILPVSQDDAAARTATDFRNRIGDRPAVLIGVGPVADGLGLAKSKAGADLVLRVLRAGRGRGPVARLSDVHSEGLLLELSDRIAERGDGLSGPLARLVAYDRKHNACLVQTLGAWLDAFGDVAAASAAVFVHPSTFRYRLRRLSEVGEIDLTDPDVRFALMLQLRLWHPGG